MTDEKKLELRWMNPHDLNPNPHNWRTHPDNQKTALNALIDEVGWAGVALYNERTKRLIDGHLRRDEAIKRGEKEIPVLVGNWSEEEELLILSSFDTIGSMAVADRIALDQILTGIETDNQAIQSMLSDLAEGAGLYFDGGDENFQDDDDEVDLDEFDPVAEVNISYRVVVEGLSLEDAEMMVDAMPNFFEDTEMGLVKYEQVREKDE